MERPKTQYAKSGDLHIAYQTLGQGPSDIVFLFPYLTHVEAGWEIPQLAHFYEELTRLGRVVLFDAAGSGMSDPAPGLIRTLDSWTNDVVAVMDAVGIARATILCTDSAGGKAMLFAATYPERVSNLILINTSAKVLRADGYPEGLPVEGRKRFLDWYLPQWAKGTLLRFYSKSTNFSEDDIERHARLERHVASPGAVRQNLNLLLDMDVREALPLIQAPTLVVHRRDNRALLQSQIAGVIFGDDDDYLAFNYTPFYIATAIEDNEREVLGPVLDTLTYITCSAGFWRDAKLVSPLLIFSAAEAMCKPGALDLIALWPFTTEA